MASTIVISSADLSAILKPVCRVARRKGSDIYSHLLLDASAKGLTLTANNSQQQITLSVPHRSYTYSSDVGLSVDRYCVHASKLESLTNALPLGSEVRLVHSEGKLMIVSGPSRFTLIALPASDYPSMGISTEKLVDGLMVAGDEISKSLRQIGFCAARNDSRHFLNGVLFEFASGRLSLAASDGHRLGVVDLAIDCDMDAKFIVPSSCIEDVALFCAGSSRVEISMVSNLVSFTTPGGGVLHSTVIDGTYPNYRQLLTAAEQGVPVQVDRADMSNALSRVAVLGSATNPLVRMNCCDENLTMQSTVSGDDAALDVLPCDYTGEPFEIGFQANLVGEAVRALASDEICVHYNGMASGTLLRAPDFPSHSFVLMPVRL
ncbi:DNA polymerase III subunit beta [Pseudomonas stutzeri]|uniref:DNA polymerase III subunit beta n=1 Tax=Stutzerimonas frequens TaxID=2968969 RepID=UPI00190B6E1D|nr:DNA polymerase III subunit beta [Stutzerimonas frequens]MBK3919866.1 DNA polymerase III subunit beta [Stutzerimonas frequens]